jgi:hypothetical protein
MEMSPLRSEAAQIRRSLRFEYERLRPTRNPWSKVVASLCLHHRSSMSHLADGAPCGLAPSWSKDSHKVWISSRGSDHTEPVKASRTGGLTAGLDWHWCSESRGGSASRSPVSSPSDTTVMEGVMRDIRTSRNVAGRSARLMYPL